VARERGLGREREIMLESRKTSWSEKISTTRTVTPVALGGKEKARTKVSVLKGWVRETGRKRDLGTKLKIL